MSQNKMIEDIINQLDKNIESGVGHINIHVNENQFTVEKIDKNDEDYEKTVEVFNSLACQKNMACNTVTIMESLDIMEDENND